MPDDVLQKDGILIALLTPLGFRAEWGGLSGYLKIAATQSIKIERSELLFLGSAGNLIETRADAFGLGRQTELTGPYSLRFTDDARRSREAATVGWRLNDMEVNARLIESEGVSLRVVYLPLLLPVKGDRHIVVTYVNRTGGMVNFAEGVRSAACIADGRRFPSNTGGHWDGGTHVQPAKAITNQFSLDDFPGVPHTGRHEMSFEMLGSRSDPEMVEWTGAEAV